MRNEENWKPSKFLSQNNELHVNKKSADLHPRSWIVTECTATAYNRYSSDFFKGKVLDLGCGLCPFYPLYKDKSSSLLCVDWANSLHKNPYTDLKCDITKPIPLDGQSFDTVILSDVLEHISEPENLLIEIHRLLRQDGHLILNVPFLYWIHEAPCDFYRYTEFGLKFLLETANFKLEVLEPVGGLLESWADITTKLSSYIPVAKHFMPQILFNLTFLLKKMGLVRSKFENLDKLFPLGYFAVARKL